MLHFWPSILQNEHFLVKIQFFVVWHQTPQNGEKFGVILRVDPQKWFAVTFEVILVSQHRPGQTRESQSAQIAKIFGWEIKDIEKANWLFFEK